MRRTIVIAGLGLIGGSLAKGLRTSDMNYIIGYDLCEKTLKYAVDHEIIHEATVNFTKAVNNADIVLLATPITETIKLMEVLNSVSFKRDVIISDVSSVKGSIIKQARYFSNKHITFIGGHPMAGSHKSGIQSAKKHLFENAIYVLIPTDDCSTDKLNVLKDVLHPTNSHFIVLQPNEHDEMTSVISHFPHLIASSLVHQAKKWEMKHTFLPELAAGGFRDITRIASSRPEMWEDIFYHNREKMLKLLNDWINEMKTLKNIIGKNYKQEMIDYLNEAKKYRDGLGVEKKGALYSFYDLYVDIKDKPGALASVVQILAAKNVNITNIQILEIREGITGALRITVDTKQAQLTSEKLLKAKGYEVAIVH